jgi:hypothetical protein
MFLERIREELKKWKQPAIDRNLQRELKHGWMLPYLLEYDWHCWRRWDYWVRTMQAGQLLDEPIPKIKFSCEGTAEGLNSPARRHLESCLDMIARNWLGWSNWSDMDYFLDWLLYGFGYPGQKMLPNAGSEVSMALYQHFNLAFLIAYPFDYWGAILAENSYGRRLGFYPTPHTVVEAMVEIVFSDYEKEQDDSRLKTVCDPCLGTGRMLLFASNYSLRLYGADINPTVIKASLVNGYLYAPWLLKPFPFLDGALLSPECSKEISDNMMEVAATRPDVAAYLADTEHDTPNQYKYEPIKKRRKKSDEKQMDLFENQDPFISNKNHTNYY